MQPEHVQDPTPNSEDRSAINFSLGHFESSPGGRLQNVKILRGPYLMLVKGGLNISAKSLAAVACSTCSRNKAAVVWAAVCNSTSSNRMKCNCKSRPNLDTTPEVSHPSPVTS